MGTTAKGFRYPESTDLVSQGATAMANLAGDIDGWLTKGAQFLGYAGSGINVGPNSTVVASPTTTGWPSIISVDVTVPTGASAAGRRVIVLGFSQISATVVGNVELGVYDGDTTLMPGASPDARITNPSTVSYGNSVWGIQMTPANGAHTYHLRAKNNAAGSWTSFAHGIAAILL